MTSDPRVFLLPGPRIKLDENQEVRQELLDFVSGGKARAVLDFQNVEFVDSSFLGFMIILLKRATASGGDVRLCAMKQPLRSTFDLMRLDRLFPLYETAEEALRSCGD